MNKSTEPQDWPGSSLYYYGIILLYRMLFYKYSNLNIWALYSPDQQHPIHDVKHPHTREKVRTWSIIKHWKKVIDHSNEGHEYLILIPINFALQLGPWLYFWEQWSRQHGGPGNVKYHQYAKIQRINETRDIFGGDNTFSLAQGSLYRLHQPVNMYTSWNIRLLPVLWAVRGEMVGLVG